ncbi:MAG: aminotransferase class I/II-fold pyridoxal phosphate-dependent enzyme [Deltaproteobacteria bacterium]|nr:aminotransferase class I/II-fold pyridoxal phosphate-dependent enzyme [Deltaproteobacteria bacterium]
MDLRQAVVDRGKRLVTRTPLLKLVSDDRVMRLAEAVMDARGRFRAAAGKAAEAWQLMVRGYGLPDIDPAITEEIEPTTKARSRGGNGTPEPDTESAPTKRAVKGTKAGEDDIAMSIESRTSLANLGGRDVFQKCREFKTVDAARKRGLYPYFRPLDLNDGPEAVLEGRRVLMLGSNNYLGLTTHPKVREAAIQAIRDYGTSMTGSRLVNGSSRLHEVFEEKLATFFNKEAALVFTTGYQVNLAVCAALLSNKRTTAVIDRNDHASIYDGVRLGQAVGVKMARYRHNDAASLDRVLSELDPDDGAFVITDGVFSAEGEIARLPELLPVCKKHNTRLFVDDAHALGVIGPVGRGSAAHFGLLDQVDLIGGTFSKSLASIGGWLVGERKVLEYIKLFASSFMFAASAAPPNVAAAMAALEVMQEEPWRITKLHENFTYIREELKKMGWDVGNSQTAVIPLYVRQDLRTIMMWKELLEQHGVYTNPFITPGVPPKAQCLRTSYMATHSREQLDRALEAFRTVGKKFGVIDG